MPNLNQVYSLKQHYTQLSKEEKNVLEYIEKSISKDTLKKSFDSNLFQNRIRDFQTFSLINESLDVKKPEIIKYFEENVEEPVALLFIDIIAFSKTSEAFSSMDLKSFLDEYYSDIIPIIYKHGGEIEKLMGDGIICVFGMPFLNAGFPGYVKHAERCAEEIIKKFHDTPKNVKVAIHEGEINYYKVPGAHYGEYTIIGKPITELYRLESISKPNGVNYFMESSYFKIPWHYSEYDATMLKEVFQIGALQGVDYNSAGHIKFNGYD